MAHSKRERHRDRDRGPRQFDEDEAPASPDRVFQLTDAERQEIAACLRDIDEARRALEGQQNAANREIIRQLRASADEIYDLIKGLDEA